MSTRGYSNRDVASFRFDGGQDVKNFEIDDGVEYFETHYRKQYEAEIKGREEEYAKDLIRKYLPEDFKKKQFPNGQLLQENIEFTIDF